MPSLRGRLRAGHHPVRRALCQRTAEDLVVLQPPSGAGTVRALSSPHRSESTARVPTSGIGGATIKVFPLADGTHSCAAHSGGTEIATCRQCGHAIYLYAALRGRREPWRAGVYDETGQCGPAEHRHAIRMVHGLVAFTSVCAACSGR